MDVTEMLDRLAEAMSQRDALALELDKLMEAATPPEVQIKLQEIQNEFGPKVDAVDEFIADLTEKVKKETLRFGNTIKGNHLMAVYVKGRVTWDGKKLDGMMILIPRLAEARKVGEPSITLRKIGD